MRIRESVRLLVGFTVAGVVGSCGGEASGPNAGGPNAGGETIVGNYLVSADGLTVTDTTTKLVWQRDGSGPRAGCGSEGSLICTWYEAEAYCAGLNLAGYLDWRLPTKDELLYIVDKTVAEPPTINQTAFPNTPVTWFWSSSPYDDSSANAWSVSFHFGFSGYLDVGYYVRVRCVH